MLLFGLSMMESASMVKTRAIFFSPVISAKVGSITPWETIKKYLPPAMAALAFPRVGAAHSSWCLGRQSRNPLIPCLGLAFVRGAANQSKSFSPSTKGSTLRTSKKKKNDDPIGISTIRRVLYPSNLRNKPAATGGWRHDVGAAIRHAIPSVQAHETIERAYLLFKRQLRHARADEISRKFNKMKEAMDTLHELQVENAVPAEWYFEANKVEDPKVRSEAEQKLLDSKSGTEAKAIDARIRGLFPREIKVPTDTPATKGWNYEWTPFPRPL
ncbi:hypothetical protein C8J56DRAFT_280941 [Mycena floridula]|nr:hypothetical protein C8J56DRAFT_280941 [Mycena floridula]